MYIILKHNPKLKAGKLLIQHVKFEKVGEDKYGYPITKELDGNPVIEDIKMYEIPYMKKEVQSLIRWLKENSLC